MGTGILDGTQLRVGDWVNVTDPDGNILTPKPVIIERVISRRGRERRYRVSGSKKRIPESRIVLATGEMKDGYYEPVWMKGD